MAELAERGTGQRPGPLTGVRVLDLGHVFQGPYATFLMAAAGADVIKIESPGGDMSRSRGLDGAYPFAALNGLKRSVVINLKEPRGKDLLLDLVRTADVLVENFAPAVMPRLGVGPDVLTEVNPRLIYASGSGFGRSGPYRDNLALDLTIQAMSGIMNATGEKDGPPLKAGFPVADFMAGAHLYGAVVTALYERERTRTGRIVEVSMLESVFASLLPNAGRAYATSQVPPRSGNRHVADSYVPFDTFPATDGWVAIVCATDKHWQGLTRAMDRPDLARENLAHLQGRAASIDQISSLIADWTRHLTREQITTACQEHHVPAAPLRDVLEVLADPHLHERGFLSSVEYPGLGTFEMPNSPIRYEGTPLTPLTPAPGLGEHTDQVLTQLCGLDHADLAKLRADGVIEGRVLRVH
jgi:CoA:oxalate CoA-transferase